MGHNVVCIADGKMEYISGGKVQHLSSQKLKSYRQNLERIKESYDWKTSGSGAQFMNQYNPYERYDTEKINFALTGLAYDGEQLYYSAVVDQISGIYTKSYEDDKSAEGLITSTQDIGIHNLSYKDGKLAAGVSGRGRERHIAVFTLPRGDYDILTEGDTFEENPCWSGTENALYFTVAGYSCGKAPAELGPRSIVKYDFDRGTMEEILDNPQWDCLKPQSGSDGSLYYIKRPYRQPGSGGNLLLDIILAPFRFIRAVGGWMNVFSMRYSGKPLRSDGHNPAQAKEKSEKELFIEGNLVKAEKNLKEAEQKGEKFPGIAPSDWVLIKLSPDGEETVLKKGVLEFTLCGNGDILYSNGKNIVCLSPDGEESSLGKVSLATKLVEVCESAGNSD